MVHLFLRLGLNERYSANKILIFLLHLGNAWAEMQARRPKFQKTGESEDVLGQWFFYEQKGWPIKRCFVVIYLKYQILLSF